MIYDRLNALERYRGLHENLDAAIDYLLAHDLAELPEGRTEVAGDAVYINKMSLDSKLEARFEAHRAYADIHIDLVGRETVELACTAGDALEPFDGETDCGFWDAQAEAVCRLEPGSFLYCPPGELHKPCMATDGAAAPIVKCCVKIRL